MSTGYHGEASYLVCSKQGCKFSYYTALLSCDEHIQEFEDWIEEHSKEIW